jgi:hypothetical protein
MNEIIAIYSREIVDVLLIFDGKWQKSIEAVIKDSSFEFLASC